MSARTFAGVRAVALEAFAELDEAETLADQVATVAMMREQDPERYRAIIATFLGAEDLDAAAVRS